EVGAEIALALDELARMGRLVDGLLELARAGALEPIPIGVFDIRQLLDDVATHFEPIADRRFDVRGDAVLVRGDREALRRVLDNLVRNAVEASDEGTAIDLTAASDNGDVVVTVRDRGRGIDPAVEPRLFQRFAHRSEGGVGLGLAISRTLVEAQGGGIDGANVDGGGAEFSIRLPAG